MNEDDNQTRGKDTLPPRLLIADDDPVVRSALSAQLRGDFEIVAVATNTAEAIELAGEHRPDVALIDVEMPGGGGVEAVSRIATSSPATRMVMLSGDESREGVIELLSAGAIAYLRKGATAWEITKTLTEALKARAPQP
jgi:DNA-binding NarL/FixJ family response regulator